MKKRTELYCWKNQHAKTELQLRGATEGQTETHFMWQGGRKTKRQKDKCEIICLDSIHFVT